MVSVGALGVAVRFQAPTFRAPRSSHGTPGSPHPIAARVEGAVELISIIHRLAGTGQYDEMELPDYVRDVWDYFEPFRDHRAVTLVREMSRTHGINGNAPMDLAVHLTPPPELELRAPLAMILDDLDSRWSADIIPPLLEATREFAVETNFETFFTAHEPLYDQAVANLETALVDTDMLPWFAEFFGRAPDGYVIVLGLLNGTCNYGSRITSSDGRQQFVSLLGGRNPDRNGAPRYARARTIPTIVHEFCHSYANPLVDHNRELLRPAGKALFAHLQGSLQRHGYHHWHVMLYEYLVRGTTVRYLTFSGETKAARTEVRRHERDGFVGVSELAALLAEYEADRTTYPDLDAFMPRIVAFFEALARRIDRG